MLMLAPALLPDWVMLTVLPAAVLVLALLRLMVPVALLPVT